MDVRGICLVKMEDISVRVSSYSLFTCQSPRSRILNSRLTRSGGYAKPDSSITSGVLMDLYHCDNIDAPFFFIAFLVHSCFLGVEQGFGQSRCKLRKG